MKYQNCPPNPITGNDDGVWLLNDAGQSILSIPYAPDNTDYQNFKANINDDLAQLETNAGVLMSPEAAKAYVATLP